MDHNSLYTLYPPSESCTCEICRNYCKRPGWWTVGEARLAMAKGFAHRMMLEISPDQRYGVLSPAFRGNEGNYAYQLFAGNGCTFLKNNLCELFATGLQPLECRFCHHLRTGEGLNCHIAIGNQWNTPEGHQLVRMWQQQMFGR